MVVKLKPNRKIKTTDPDAIAINDAYQSAYKAMFGLFRQILHGWKAVGELLKKKRAQFGKRDPRWKKWCEANLVFCFRRAQLLIWIIDNWGVIEAADPQALSTLQDVIDLIRGNSKQKESPAADDDGETVSPHQDLCKSLDRLKKELRRKEPTLWQRATLTGLAQSIGQQLTDLAAVTLQQVHAGLAADNVQPDMAERVLREAGAVPVTAEGGAAASVPQDTPANAEPEPAAAANSEAVALAMPRKDVQQLLARLLRDGQSHGSIKLKNHAYLNLAPERLLRFFRFYATTQQQRAKHRSPDDELAYQLGVGAEIAITQQVAAWEEAGYLKRSAPKDGDDEWHCQATAEGLVAFTALVWPEPAAEPEAGDTGPGSASEETAPVETAAPVEDAASGNASIGVTAGERAAFERVEDLHDDMDRVTSTPPVAVGEPTEPSDDSPTAGASEAVAEPLAAETAARDRLKYVVAGFPDPATSGPADPPAAPEATAETLAADPACAAETELDHEATRVETFADGNDTTTIGSISTDETPGDASATVGNTPGNATIRADGSASVAVTGSAPVTLTSAAREEHSTRDRGDLNKSFRDFRKTAFGLPSAAWKVGLSRTQLDELLVRFPNLKPTDTDNVTQDELTTLDAAVKQFRADGTLNADGNLTLVPSQS